MSKKLIKPLLVVAAVAVNVIPGVGQIASAAMISAITTAGITAGIGLAASAIGLGPKSPQVSPATRDRLYANIDPATPRKSLFGRTALATDIRYQEWTGAEQEYLHQIVHVASHKVAAIREVWLDDKLAWTAAGGTQGEFVGYLTITPRLEGNAGNYIVIGSGAKWGASRRMTGLAYLHMVFKVTGNSKKKESPFAQSIPTRMTVVGDGMPVYDARFDSTRGGDGPMRADDQTTWAFTYSGEDIGRNPANQLLTRLLGWRINGKLALGSGIPPARIDFASFITAANACDEPVVRVIGGTEPRYRADGIFSEADDPRQVIDTYEATMNAKLRDAGGRFSLYVISNDLATPRFAYNDSDVLGEFRWDPTPEIDRTYNEVRGRYTNATAASLFQLVDYPRYRQAPVDGIERVLPFDLPLVQSPSQAQRLAKQLFARNNYQGRFQCNLGPRGWAVQQGDVITLTFSALGWEDRLFRVIEHGIRTDGICPVVLQEENADIYLWDADERPEVQPVETVPYDPAKSVLMQLLTAGEIDYADGSSLQALKPAEPGADVTGDHTSANTEMVGDRTADAVNNDLDTMAVQLDDILTDLETIDLGGLSAAVDAAEAARDAAQTARDEAEAAYDAAASEAAAATAAASLAGGSATTAAGHATTASTKADEASGSATAAAASATTASTAAGNASTSASNASTSASDAAGSASSAASNATVAANAGDAAFRAAVDLIPSTFEQDGRFFMDTYSGDPASAPKRPENTGWTFPTVTAVGKVAQRALGVSAGASDLSNYGLVAARAGRRYRLTAQARITSGLSADVVGDLFFISIQGDRLTYAGTPASNGAVMPDGNAWTSISVEATGDSLLTVGPYFRALIRLYSSSGAAFTEQIRLLKIEDITSEAAAGSSATAAASSASSAAASQSAAGSSASAANTSATNAATSAGQANTYATNASTSATNADASEAAAASSAGTAASHAGAASSSAGTAASQASAAGASAAAATASATLAAQLSMSALNSNPIFARWTTPGGIADDWNLWSSGGGYSRAAGGRFGSPYALEYNTPADGNYYGWHQNNVPVGRGYYVIEANINLISGSPIGAAVFVNIYDTFGSYLTYDFLDFGNDASTAGIVINAPGEWGFSKLISLPAAAANVTLFAMNNYPVAIGNATKNIRWYRAAIRPASAEEIRSGTTIPTLQATVTSQSGAIATLQGRALAFWQVETVAGLGNGATAFISARAESSWGAGATSTVAFGAREVLIYNPTAGGWQKALSVEGGNVNIYGKLNVTGGIAVSPDGKTRLDLEANRIVFNNGTVMKVTGTGFGSANQFVEWFGPTLANVNLCTEANGTIWAKTNGDAYFGGSLATGVLRNSTTGTSIASNATHLIGPFGSNGGPRVINLGYTWSNFEVNTSPCGAAVYPTAQLKLYKGTNNSGTLLATLNIGPGTWSCTGSSPGEPGNINTAMGGSVTVTDNSGGTSNISYFAEIVARTVGAVGGQTQQISITSVEE